MNGAGLEVSASVPIPGSAIWTHARKLGTGYGARTVLFLMSIVALFFALVGHVAPQDHTMFTPIKQLSLTQSAKSSPQPWVARDAFGSVKVALMSGDKRLSRQQLSWVTSVIENQSWPVLEQLFPGQAPKQLNLVLFATQTGYQAAVAGQFSGDAKEIATKTGGFTVGTTVYVPVYKYTSKASLANTIAHEFTHVFLNAGGISRALPQWVNEGFAWTVGIQAQSRANRDSTKVLLHSLTTELNTARKAGPLAPLTTGTAVGLQKNFEYNLEFEDYLAVNQLENTYGMPKTMEFLRNAVNVGVAASFERSFGMSIEAYERTFYHGLSIS